MRFLIYYRDALWGGQRKYFLWVGCFRGVTRVQLGLQGVHCQKAGLAAGHPFAIWHITFLLHSPGGLRNSFSVN